MIAIIKFNLDNPDDRIAHKNAIDGYKYKNVVWDLDQWLRSKAKYEDKWWVRTLRQFKKQPDESITIDDIRDQLRELLSEWDVTMED